MTKMRFRLALSWSGQSVGWSMVRLNAEGDPQAVIKCGVRVFGHDSVDAVEPWRGWSTAGKIDRVDGHGRPWVHKWRTIDKLVRLGFFPVDPQKRKALEKFDPYALRQLGLDYPLQPEEFARAVFHLSQFVGQEGGVSRPHNLRHGRHVPLETELLRRAIAADGCRTVGEWFCRRRLNGDNVALRPARSRREGGHSVEIALPTYWVDRSLIEAEFDLLWQAQAAHDPKLYNDKARSELRNVLLFQRSVHHGQPGRCLLMPHELCAPLALPSAQRMRLYRDVDALRLVGREGQKVPLSKAQRDILMVALEHNKRLDLKRISKVLGVAGTVCLSGEDASCRELRGNATSVVMSRPALFGSAWHGFDLSEQDEIVERLLHEENESVVIRWLQQRTGIDEARAQAISAATLPQGFAYLSSRAMALLLPRLMDEGIDYLQALEPEGLSVAPKGRWGQGSVAMDHLPDHEECVRWHLEWGDGASGDRVDRLVQAVSRSDIHHGLVQIRKVVNALIRRYGHPHEVVVSVSKALQCSREEWRRQVQCRKGLLQREQHWRDELAVWLQMDAARVRPKDVLKVLLWEELHDDPAQRCCPFTGEPIDLEALLSPAVEVVHLYPMARTFDDTLDNMTVALRGVGQLLRHRSPGECREDLVTGGIDYDSVLRRARFLPRPKRSRFEVDGWAQAMRGHQSALQRALEDVHPLTRWVCDYLGAICPDRVRAVDPQPVACVTRLLFPDAVPAAHQLASMADARKQAMEVCVMACMKLPYMGAVSQWLLSTPHSDAPKNAKDMPLPWPCFREHVTRAVGNVWVSHKPARVVERGGGVDDVLMPSKSGKPVSVPLTHHRHSGYCIDIVCNAQGVWETHWIRENDGAVLDGPDGHETGQTPKSRVMRLRLHDCLKLDHEGASRVMRVVWVDPAGGLQLTEHQRLDARNVDGGSSAIEVFKTASALQSSQVRKIRISPLGELKAASGRD